MDIRHPPCAFCRTPRVRNCPRCEAPGCADHGVRGDALWCAVCEKERIDDVKFAVAQAKLASPWIDKSSWGGDRSVVKLVSVLAHVVTGPIRVFRARRAAEQAFPNKSREEIASWRTSRPFAGMQE